MIKKISTILFVVLLFTFTACDNNNNNSTESIINNTSESSNNEESIINGESSEEINVESSEDTNNSQTVSLEISNINDNIYYGNGFNFLIPEGYSFCEEKKDYVVFLDKNNISFYVQTLEMSENVNIQTEEDFRDFYGDSVVDFKETTIDGEYATYGIYTDTINSVKYNFCEYCIYTDEFFINIYYSYADDVTKEILNNTMSNFIID